MYPKESRGYTISAMTTAEDYWKETANEADERHAPIIRAYESGMTQQEIAAEIGKTKGRVSQIIRRARERGLIDEGKRERAVAVGETAADHARREAVRQMLAEMQSVAS